MRERKLHAQQRRNTRKFFYQLACEIVDEFLSLPMIQSNLEFSLRFLKLTPDEQAHEFKELVELNSRRCVYGEPELGIARKCKTLLRCKITLSLLQSPPSLTSKRLPNGP